MEINLSWAIDNTGGVPAFPILIAPSNGYQKQIAAGNPIGWLSATPPTIYYPEMLIGTANNGLWGGAVGGQRTQFPIDGVALINQSGLLVGGGDVYGQLLMNKGFIVKKTELILPSNYFTQVATGVGAAATNFGWGGGLFHTDAIGGECSEAFIWEINAGAYASQNAAGTLVSASSFVSEQKYLLTPQTTIVLSPPGDRKSVV